MGNKTTNNTYSDTKNRSLTERTSFRFAFLFFLGCSSRCSAFQLSKYGRAEGTSLPVFPPAQRLPCLVRFCWFSLDTLCCCSWFACFLLETFLGSLNALFFSHDDALCHKCTNHKPHSLTPVFFSLVQEATASPTPPAKFRLLNTFPKKKLTNRANFLPLLLSTKFRKESHNCTQEANLTVTMRNT